MPNDRTLTRRRATPVRRGPVYVAAIASLFAGYAPAQETSSLRGDVVAGGLAAGDSMQVVAVDIDNGYRRSVEVRRDGTRNFDTGDPDNPCAGCPAWDPIYAGSNNILLGANGIESDADSSFLRTSRIYDETSGWGFHATYTYTDATQNRPYGGTFALDYPWIDSYRVLTSTGVARRRFAAAGNVDLPSPSGTVTPGIGWIARDHIGIDQGPILAMLEHHRSELIWRTMRRSPYIRAGLREIGFTGGWLE